MNNCIIKIVFIFYALCSLPLISVSQNLLLGDYIPGNGITLASDDDNYKVVLRGYAQSLFESRRVRYDSVGFFDKSVYNRFRARRVRLRISGKQSNPGFSYRLQLNLAESEVENDTAALTTKSRTVSPCTFHSMVQFDNPELTWDAS